MDGILVDVMTLDPTTLGSFGIRPEDEHVHRASPDEPHWNESVFYDWIAGPEVAGHVRIGRAPNQGRVWLWVFLRIEGEWLVLEQPHLPLAAFGDGFDADLPGLRIRRSVETPLLVNRLQVAGTARQVTGERAGALVPFEIDLGFEAVGPAHSLGEQTLAGHSTEAYSSNRYEQPVKVRGHHRVGTRRFEVEGHGERDHSWGPRMWNMEWYFMVLHGPSERVQTARVVFDEDAYVAMGYSHEASMENIVDNQFELRFDDASPRRPFEGRVSYTTESDLHVAGRVEVIDACAIDANHCFEPPQPSHYVRALVRFHPDGGGPALPGWLEVNRFVHGLSEVGFP